MPDFGQKKREYELFLLKITFTTILPSGESFEESAVREVRNDEEAFNFLASVTPMDLPGERILTRREDKP